MKTKTPIPQAIVREFWAAIYKYLTSDKSNAREQRTTLFVTAIKNGHSFETAPPLPFRDKFFRCWGELRAFLNHVHDQGWSDDKIIDQLKLVAQGVDDEHVELECAILPLIITT